MSIVRLTWLAKNLSLLNQRYLRRLLRQYAEYQNGYRTHLGLAKDTPFGRAAQYVGRVTSLPQLGGLHQF